MAKSETPNSEAAPAPATQKARSPNYPAMSLKEAVEKVGKLYEKNTRFAVPVTATAAPMDYGPKSSSFIQAIATLKSYGLIDVTGTAGDRKVAVSERGQKIVVNHKDRPQLLQEAALSPAIYKELWGSFYKPGDGLAPDQSIEHYLTIDRPEPRFAPKAATALVGEFKATIAFAKLADGAKMSRGDDGQGDGDQGNGQVDPQGDKLNKTPPPPGVREFSFPLIDGAAVLRVPHPMGQANFNMLQAILNAAKEALIGPPPKAEEKP